MIPTKVYDIIILGAGPGGYETAIYASKNGFKVLLVEANKLGGTCLNCGCIPTKSYYASAKMINNINNSLTLGITTTCSLDFSKVFEHKNNVIEELTKGIEFSLKQANVDIVYGFGKIIGENEVLCNDIIYSTENIIIATGSKNMSGMIDGSDTMLDSTDLLNMKSCPKSLNIVGGGVIGIEMASIFTSFGVEVNVFEMQNYILPNMDIEISRRIQNYLKKLGVKIHTKTIVKSFHDNKLVYQEKDELCEIVGDATLLAIGRKPNIDNIGLDIVNVQYNNKGIITNNNFQTNISNIYAIGDCNGKVLLAHYAKYSGKFVIDKLINKDNATNFNIVPSAIFTFPEIASVGITEEQANTMNIEYTIKKVLYRSNGKALASNETEGFVKVIISNNKIVGVHIIGSEASILIHEAVMLMNDNINVSDASDYIYCHPTLSEIFKECLN